MAILYRVAQGDLRAPTSGGPLSGPLTEILSVDPARRPGMTEVRDRLRSLPASPAGPALVAPAARPEPPESGRPSRTRRRAVILAALVVVLAAVLAGGTLLVLSPTGEHGTPAAAPPSATKSMTSPETRTPAAPPPPTGSAPPGTSTPTTTSGAGQTTPAGTVTGYYALMPDNLPQAWTWLTARYQQHPAGGYGGYQTFWGRIRTVQVSGVNPLSANQVDATVDYTFRDGRTVREEHRYTLVNQAGRWLIDQSTVLSSVTR